MIQVIAVVQGEPSTQLILEYSDEVSWGFFLASIIDNLPRLGYNMSNVSRGRLIDALHEVQETMADEEYNR